MGPERIDELAGGVLGKTAEFDIDDAGFDLVGSIDALDRNLVAAQAERQFPAAAQNACAVPPAGANTYTVPQPSKAVASIVQSFGRRICVSPVQPMKAF